MGEGYVEMLYIIPVTLPEVWNYFKLKSPRNNRSKKNVFKEKEKEKSDTHRLNLSRSKK